MRITPQDKAKVLSAGYRVERQTGFMGKPVTPAAWTLYHAENENGHLLIGDHGMVSPTEWEAYAEALFRIDLDNRLAGK